MEPDHERRRDDYYAEADRIREERDQLWGLACRLRNALRAATLADRDAADHALLDEADRTIKATALGDSTGTPEPPVEPKGE